uniref:Non-specific lipid-transfer protein n=1 Tax=Zea mays TaxID=4577 RepID=B6TG19_MAIZE|nr:nonspecific lipid-transfer protein 3 precursor [Zea mays]
MKTTSSGIAVVLLVADISCSDVLNDLSPCLPFLQGKAAKPSESNNQCCDGVRTLYAAADTRPDRQATCRCLKAAYVQVHAVLSAAQELPGDCGLSLSYNITPDIDCDKFQSEESLASPSSNRTKNDRMKGYCSLTRIHTTGW